MPCRVRRRKLEGLLAERLHAALEAHLVFWPFDLGPATSAAVSFDVSPLHPFVVSRFELDSIGCRNEPRGRQVEFLARGALREALVAEGFQPSFLARIPGLEVDRILCLGERVPLPEISMTPRLVLVRSLGPAPAAPEFAPTGRA